MIQHLARVLRTRPIAAFFVLTTAIAWSIWLPVGLFAPRYFLFAVLPGAWAPSLSAVVLTWAGEGAPGVRRLLARLLKWRVGLRWYLVVLFGSAAVAYLAIGINVLFGGRVPQLSLPPGVPHDAWLIVLPLVFVINVFVGGPLAEDIGWRGYILPKLRERLGALNAGLVVGVVWVAWHAPFFIFPEGRSVVGNIPFVWFALMTTAWSVLFAWVYVNTGSILMPVLFHAAINTTLGSLGLLGQTSGSVTPLALNTALTWAAVGAVVLFYGRDLVGTPRPPQPRRTWSGSL
ncbi:MAG: CPBP family intramembrane glutamic endopeptidase [Caulobacterales bacterium]